MTRVVKYYATPTGTIDRDPARRMLSKLEDK